MSLEKNYRFILRSQNTGSGSGGNSSKSEDIVNKQDEIPGQRKEVNVENYGEASSIGQILKDLEFPANKNKIIEFARSKNCDENTINKLEQIEDKEYKNTAEVTTATGIVSS
jgi:Protein of unknown function (DUF2795)